MQSLRGNLYGDQCVQFSLTSFLIGRYNMKANAATNVNNIFSGTFNFSPVVGAFVADALWGRFRTLLFGTAVGVLVSWNQSHYSSTSSCSVVLRHHNRPWGCSWCPLQRAVLYVAMGLLVVSAAGTNPTSQPLTTRSGITTKIYFTR